MKKFLTIGLFSLFASTLLADDQYGPMVKVVEKLKGYQVIEKFNDSPAQFDGVFQGDIGGCQAEYSHRRKKYATFVFSHKGKVYPFIIYPNHTYTYTREQNDGPREVPGFFTRDTISVGSHDLIFYQQGDMGFSVSYKKGGKYLFDCDMGY